MKEDLLNRIKIDSNICYGRPVIGKLNRPLANILNLLSAGQTNEQIIIVYNELDEEDIEACRLYDAKAKYIPDDKNYFEDAKNGSRPFSDFEWFAIDFEGKIARFTSAGFGMIPQVVFKDFLDYINLRNYLNNLPDISDYKICVDVDYSLEDYIKLSKQGVYSYDFDSQSGRYRKVPYSLLVSPTNPLSVSDLDKKYANHLQNICFQKISFRNNNKIIVEKFFDNLND